MLWFEDLIIFLMVIIDVIDFRYCNNILFDEEEEFSLLKLKIIGY